MCVVLLSLIIVAPGLVLDKSVWEFISHATVHFSKPFPIGNLIEVDKEMGSKAGRVELLEFEINLSKCKTYSSPYKDYIYFNVDGIPPSGKPGEPQLPLKSFVVKLPLGSEVMGVEVVSGTYVKINNYLKIVPTPTPLIRHKQKQKGGEYIVSPQIYNLTHYFPGRLVGFEKGADNNFTYCFVRLFPLQYIPAQGKAILITSAKIAIYYQNAKRKTQNAKRKTQNAKSIIICPQEFQTQAESLKSFHEVELGLSAFVATTEWISVNYDTAQKPPFSGWSYVDTSTAPIYGYNFTLARKIIAYLKDTASHPNLEYITILGDAQKVPPSYYFVWGEWYDGYDFAPSDFLYSSPDYDFVPNYGAGRLSVSDTSELAHIIRKIKDWYPGDWSWFKNTIIAGGDPFPTYFPYYDEAILCDCINQEYFSGGNNLKCFLSDEKFTAGVLSPYLSNGDLGIFFESGHGSGDAIYFDDYTSISATDLLGYPPAVDLPIVATPACVVGAFDMDLAPDLSFTTSFGEAVLKSKAGGICFYGGSRSNYAGFDYYIDEGRLVITRHRYFDEIFTNVAKSYHALKDTLGAIYKNTLFEFVSSNDMVGDTLNQWSLFCFTLLGDPALPIPPQVPGPNYETPQLSASSPTYYDTRSYPVHHLSGGAGVTINSTTNSPTVKYKLCNAMAAEAIIDTTSDNTQPFDYTFSADSGMHFYIVRTESEDKKEGWLYTYTTTGDIVVDGDPQDWDSAGISPCATDSNDFTPEDYELTTLYVTDDKYNWYFGFDAYACSTWVDYMIAIDCKAGGYTGIEGVDKDALGNWVTFGNNHPVDYEIALWASAYGVYPLWGTWTGSSWDLYYPLTDLGGYVAFDTTSHFFEIMLPKSLIGDPSVMHLSLYSGGWNFSTNETSPALDAVPTDTATYDTVVWGSAYANTITSFVTVYETGVEETYQKNKPILSLNIFPNPSSGNAIIHYSINLLTYQPINLSIYDLCGRLVKSFAPGTGKAGKYSIKWNTSNLPSGVYFVKLKAGDYKLTKKLIVVK